jgi:hypothetical protein
MWIVKWVEMDCMLSYYPCLRIFGDYNKARNYQLEKEEEIEKQFEKIESLYDGKILSEIYLEEIRLVQE